MIQHRTCILLFCLLAFLLTGCWDRVEIEQRGFVVGSTVDVAQDENNLSNESKRLMMTNQIVVPAGLGAPTQGGSQQKAYTNVSASGESLFAISREMATKTSRTPFFEHLKLVVISEEVAKTPHFFSNSLDLFIRDHEMRRGVKVMVAEGKAKNILETNPENEKLPILNIESIIENDYKNANVLEPVRIGNIHGFILDRSSFVIPKISSSKGTAHEKGGAVFHGHTNKMVGTLNGKQTKGLNFIRGDVKSGDIRVEVNGHLVAYEIVAAKRSIKVKENGKENLEFTANIETEGNVAETFGGENLLDQQNLTKIEEKVAAKIEQLVKQTTEKVHEELKVDVLGFDKVLKQKQYDTWKKVKDDWDHGENYFAKSNINVTANAIIRTTGSSDQTKSRKE